MGLSSDWERESYQYSVKLHAMLNSGHVEVDGVYKLLLNWKDKCIKNHDLPDLLYVYENLEGFFIRCINDELEAKKYAKLQYWVVSYLLSIVGFKIGNRDRESTIKYLDDKKNRLIKSYPDFSNLVPKENIGEFEIRNK